MFANRNFRSRVSPTYAGHHPAAGLLVHNVHHPRESYAADGRGLGYEIREFRLLKLGLANEGPHDPCDLANYRYYNSVSELLISASIRNRNLVRVRETHEPRALAGCQATRILFGTLIHKNFRAVLKVSGGKRTGNVAWFYQAKAKAISFGLMLLRVRLQIRPEVVRKRVLGVNAPLFVIEEAIAV